MYWMETNRNHLKVRGMPWTAEIERQVDLNWQTLNKRQKATWTSSEKAKAHKQAYYAAQSRSRVTRATGAARAAEPPEEASQRRRRVHFAADS